MISYRSNKSNSATSVVCNLHHCSRNISSINSTGNNTNTSGGCSSASSRNGSGGYYRSCNINMLIG